MSYSRNLIIGKGQIGTALNKILEGEAHDPPQNIYAKAQDCTFLHICTPYNDDFEDIVDVYKKKFRPNTTIIHSTVPVGTSKELNAVHSPIRGVHPDLEEGIRTFVKYVGGQNADIVAEELEKYDIETKVYEKAKTTEAGKLLSTTQYGIYIMISKKIHEYCEDKDLDYDKVYKHFNATYNSGYYDLGKTEVMRPIFDYVEGDIGGHCVIPNTDLMDWDMADWLKKENDDLHGSK